MHKRHLKESMLENNTTFRFLLLKGFAIPVEATKQCYQFGVSGSALRSFSWGIPSEASYCGDTENEAIDEAINWIASVVLEGEDGM